MSPDSVPGSENLPFRILPRLVAGQNDFFWTSGSDGLLRLLRCKACGFVLHPPSPRCPMCLSKDLDQQPVSGTGRVYTWTVNHQPWIPGFDPPYVIALVELDDQVGLRLLSNIVGCDPDEVHIGMAVEVTFQRYEERGEVVWIPVFRPSSIDAARDRVGTLQGEHADAANRGFRDADTRALGVKVTPTRGEL
ncbi:MAG: Zn-ribbon domain-containing OB-fold protein [Actinomycetota bacterium]|nr:Zn-ribbon domain-containing OB-fold protein [Actinomycetota bacterium]